MEVRFSSIWSDSHGVHKLPTDKASIDVLCIYCPDTDRCYYLDPSAFGKSVTLRLTPTLNNQATGVLAAERYESLRF